MKISNTAAKHITDFFINSGTISNDDRASYIYCFEYAIDTIIFPLTILLSGLIFNRFISALLFAVIIIPLKMSAGGAHASTRIMCSILSYSLYFVTLFCYQLLGNIPLTLLNICYIICCVLIMYLSPVEPQKQQTCLRCKAQIKKILYYIYNFNFNCIYGICL